MNSAGSLNGLDLNANTLHSYLHDSTFVEYFNSFLLLSAFSTKVFYNEETDYFEQVFACGVPSSGGALQREGGGGGGRGGSSLATPSFSSTSMSTLYLTDDCMGSSLDRGQCWQWVVGNRLPLFKRSDLFSEFKLCKMLAAPGLLDPQQGPQAHVESTGKNPSPSSRPFSPSPSAPLKKTRDFQRQEKVHRTNMDGKSQNLYDNIPAVDSILRVSTSTTSLVLPSLSRPRKRDNDDRNVNDAFRGKDALLVNLSSAKCGVEGSKSSIELGHRGINLQTLEGTRTTSSSSQPNINTGPSRDKGTVNTSSDMRYVNGVREVAVDRGRSGRPRKRTQSAVVDVCSGGLLPSTGWPSLALLSTKSGMYSLWRFLQGTAGERSWLFWLDAERLKYCTTDDEERTLLRGLRECYLSAGGPLELPTDTKFRLGTTRHRMGGVANVQLLQDMLVENLRHYWCHRFLLHQQHKLEKKSQTRPHTSPAIYTQQNNHTCLYYPRVETPLIPSKTPTFHRISKKDERSQTAMGKFSRPRSRLSPVTQNSQFEQAFTEKNSPTTRKMDAWQRVRGRRKGESLITGRRSSSKGRGEGDRGSEMVNATQNTFRSISNSKRGAPTKSSHLYASDRSDGCTRNSVLDSSPRRQLCWSSGSPRLPQSLRQSYTSTPVWGMDHTSLSRGPHTPAPTESDATQPPAGFPPSRSAEYHKLTKYTPRHLPVAESDTHGQHSPLPSHKATATPVTTCHILSISGTPLLPPSHPPTSPFSHMLQCLATEHRKAGGYFKQYLQSLADGAPLHCLLFWREVQDYKAMFVGPSFSPAAVQIKAKALFSCYVAESATNPLSLPPSLPSHLSPLLHPPYDDLFDTVEEHVLGVLSEHWEQLCCKEEAAFQRVDTVSVSRTGSASRRRPPSTASYTALDDLSEEVDINTYYNDTAHTSSHPHTTPTGTTPHSSHLSPSPHPHSSQFSSFLPSPLSHHSPTLHTLTPSLPPAPKAVGLNDIISNPTELEHFKIFLNENMAARHLMCWMEIEAFRGIPARDKHLRDMRARQLRERYFTRKYLLGPDSPASKEAQRQLVRTDDIRTERVNEEILPGRKLISMQQIHQLRY